jgi:NAD-dependent SIR2 family protein deacetylase
MRFVTEGPDIPNDLIREWRSGEVLFLAGAGVSAPSKLPLFEGLTLGVYKSLGDPLFDILAKAKKRRRVSGREKVISEANLSPDKQVEANLFFERQYDRLFSALEKRVDPDLRALR